MPSSHLTLCHPLLLLPPIPPSMRVFSNELTGLIRWPNYWSFSLSISPSSEHPGLVSFRMDWLGLLAVWGTLKSLLQHHSLKGAQTWHSAFFMVQLSYPYTNWKQTKIILLFLRLHPSTAFQTLADYEDYSIFSKGVLPTVVDITVVDIMVIWIKFAYFHPF